MSDDEERPSTPPAPETAWGRDGVVPPKKKHRRRITLSLGGPPLALPGEDAPKGSSKSSGSWPALEPASGSISLPPPARARGDQTEPDLRLPEDAVDGWGRSSAPPSPALARPRSVTPPPSPQANVDENVDALSLVAAQGRRSTSPEPVDFRREMRERFALGDYSGALRAAELELGRVPEDPGALECAAACREKLGQLYAARLGGGRRRLEVAVRASDVRWLGIDHRAGFLLSTIDGRARLDDVVDMSGMPRHEALKLLVELFEAGAIRLT